MHSIDLLEEALKIAMNSGFEVRQEWLEEKGGGVCRIGQKRVLFVDLSLTARDQLEQVTHALKSSGLCRIDGDTSPQLRDLLC